MRLILVVLLFIPLLAISCIDKEFESELKFVQSIIDYPQKMDSIIKNSPFYNELEYNSKTKDFKYLSDVLTRNENAEIVNYCYSSLYNRDGSITDSTKSIKVKFGGDNYSFMSFIFKEIEGKVILILVSLGR
jgi:hypothetical protein